MCDGEVIYQDGKFTRVDKDSALKQLHDDLSARRCRTTRSSGASCPRRCCRMRRRFYADYIDPSRHEPFYRPSSRV